jgi:hypothetical protein
MATTEEWEYHPGKPNLVEEPLENLCYVIIITNC